MAILSIRHLTRYRYRRPVGFGEHRMMLRPLEGPDQKVLSAELRISPRPRLLRHLQDSHGAWTSIATFGASARALEVESRVRIEHAPVVPYFDVGHDVWGADRAFAYDETLLAELRGSMAGGPAHGAVARWARRFAGPSVSLAATLAEMTLCVHETFGYRRRLESGTQPPEETLRLGTGCCRDFAVLMIEAVRSLGLAARYVLGYVHSAADLATMPDGPAAARGGHTHAWTRVFLPSSGWVDFDPTNGIVGGADLIRVAVARSPAQTSPLCGLWDGEAADFLGMDVEVDVVRDPAARSDRARAAPTDRGAVRPSRARERAAA